MKRNWDSSCNLNDFNTKNFSKNTNYQLASVKSIFKNYLSCESIVAVPKDAKILDNILQNFWLKLKKV